MNHPLHLIILLLLISTLFYACYEQSIKINNDNASGLLEYNISYNKDFTSFINYLSDINNNIELNTNILFDKNKIKQLFTNSDGISLLNQTITQKDDFNISNISFTFTEFKKIPNQLPITCFSTSIYDKNMFIYCRTKLSLKKFISAASVNINDKEQLLLNNYAAMIKFKFVFHAPKNIYKTNLGIISTDKKTLLYETNLYKLLNASPEEQEIIFSYSKY